MPSTYTSNLGIELPADGELDGVWGDVVNDNMSIIDRAVNGSVSLSLSGTSSTLTTTDGTLSDGQYKLLVLAGSPSGTHTITISPNDAQKIYFVYNTTAQSVVFTQGSGGNVTIATGDSGIIYSNGGGAGAAVVNLTDHFAMSSVKITGGSITGITDLAIADGGTGSSTAAGALINFGLTATAAELNYTDGVTSNIQTQLDAKQPLDAELTAIAALAVTDGNFIVGNGTTWVAESGATARTSLGLGSIATQASSSVSITGGSITGITDLAVADGGTGASTAADALINFGLTATAAELNYSDGVTSNIQTQLDGKAPLTGTGASGTWGISITGNAATATQLATSRNINGVGFNGTADINVPDLRASNGTVLVDGTGVTSAVNYATLTNAATGGTVTLSTEGTDTNIPFQITTKGTGAVSVTTAGGAINMRPGTSGFRIYDDSNTYYHNFATGTTTANRTVTLPNANVTLVSGTMVPTTGTGATGTWGISISGNAATVTTVTAAQVGGAYADLASRAVGTYIVAWNTTTTAVASGGTIAGSSLRYQSALASGANPFETKTQASSTFSTTGNTALTGTWMALTHGGGRITVGSGRSTSYQWPAAIWLRTA